MPFSETDLINNSLLEIGGTEIANRTDGSTNAIKADNRYDSLRDGLLADAHWKFATKLVKLASISVEPVFGFDTAFQLPGDWIDTVGVYDNDAGVGFVNWEEAEVDGSGVILTSAVDVFLKYIYKVTDPNRFSDLFRIALEYALARDLAIPVAQSRSLRADMKEEAEKALRRAKSHDSLKQPPPRRPRGSWAASRNVWPSWRWPR